MSFFLNLVRGVLTVTGIALIVVGVGTVFMLEQQPEHLPPSNGLRGVVSVGTSSCYHGIPVNPLPTDCEGW